MSRPGERQRPTTPTDSDVDAAILAECARVGAGKSVSPNDVAKSLDAENWRRCLKPVKRRAQYLAQKGQVQILRKGKPIDPDLMKGVVRLRLAG